MRRCCLIITNDSGPMHVAISQKVPIVAMYGPSNPKLYGPYTKDAVIVTAQPPCQGCADGMKHSCDDLQCMSRMTVEQVVDGLTGGSGSSGENVRKIKSTSSKIYCC